MVSPYKKKKLDKKGRVPALEEVNPLKCPGNRRTRTSIKPLTDKKFYLDIKNHASLKKIEAKLTSLGARLELFLVREVDYVVTDREDYPRVGGRHQQVPTPSPLPSFCSVSPATPTSPHDGLASKRTRSRAEAMLERVRHQPQTKDTADILDNAVTWRIPIYPLPRFINWLEKVAKKAEKLYDNGGKIVEKGVRELRGTYLKVETSSRPEFKQFNNWPTLGLHKENNAQQNNRNHSNECQRMTRKAGKAAKEASSAPGGGNGYCEMCRIHYDHLDSHVTSVEHLKLVSDPNHYSHLDSIIAQHNLGVTSVRKSLRIAKSPPPFLPPEMGGRQSSETINNHSNVNHHNHPPPTASSPQINGHLTRSKAAANALNSQTPPQPTVHLQCNGSVLERRRSKTQSRGDSPTHTTRHQSHHESTTPGRRPVTPPSTPVYQEHNLRPRRTTPRRTTPPPPPPSVTTTFTTPAPPKETTPPPQPPVTRQHQHSPNVIPSPHQNTTPNQPIVKPTLPPPRRTSRVVRKRLSVEEKLIEDNKSYYKVEVLSSKLRSTEYFISQNKVEAQTNNRINGTVSGTTVVQPDSKSQSKTPVKAPVVVRFKKVRKTELAVLSDEAESFMFGEPKKAASIESSDSSDDDDDDDERSTGAGDDDVDNSTSNNTTLSTSRAKVEQDDDDDDDDDDDEDDDDDDVKPSLPVLRPPSSPSHTGPPPSSPPRLQHIKEEPDDSSIEKKDITFSFDRAPLREPWLETYRRQDEGNEIYIPQYHSYPSLLLPYQIPQERHFKKYQSGDITGSVVSGVYPASGSGRRKGRLSKVIDDRPRKSPRCHASTLAIMSSLMRRHRPGRECERPFTYEEDSSLASDIIESSSNSERLVTPQQTSSTGNTCGSIFQQAVLSAVLNPEGIDRIGEALLNGKTEISTIEPCLAVDPKAISDGISFVNNSKKGLQMDVSTLIDTYHQCTSLEVAALEKAPPRPFESVRFGADSCASSDCSDVFGFLDDGRVVSKKRKRKRNMTGWPQPKRKIVNNHNNNNNNNSNNNNNNNSNSNNTTTPARLTTTTSTVATSSTLKDILEDEPPVDINQFECIVNSSGDDESPKRRGRPPKTRLSSLNNSPSTPMFVSSPLRRKVHKLFAHRRSYLK
ncbi:hypothetical protein O3M35_012605 [Rhynocoris fuscipes]|uniref:DBF4-type domain-containing protein n=1 Tax=Rhynocoris fuscipes TaxID=488301 RepID=A0AAW1CWF2_9HEMI